MNSVLVWIIYDIVDDKARAKVAKTCKQYGLERVQKSAFLGKLKMNRFDELSEKCLSLINEEEDRVYLFPFCQDDFKKIKVLGQGFDKKLINEEILSKFF
ncbi:MAG TPA: CRISPR-associated endonuclease Cas2 [Desulfobacterales bacterium]|nr:CRISPR-associated endonuclease Cas2 [Desulfobacterales bacterium]